MAVDTDTGAFLPTTDVFDRTLVDAMDLDSPEFKDFLVRLYQTTNNIALAVNIKDTGYYVDTEFVCGQIWYPNKSLSSTTAQAPEYRQVFRKVIIFGALPNASAKTVAHGIAPTDAFQFTRIYATASDTTGHTYLPIPYASQAAATSSIELSVDATNITIDTGAVDRTAYDTCDVVCEYIKQ